MRGDGPPLNARPEDAGPPGPGEESPARLEVPQLELPAAPAPSGASDAIRLASVAAAHAVLIALLLMPATRLGAGGSDLDAIGIEIVTQAPALEARSITRGRGAASADVAVRDRDGDGQTAPEQQPTADSRSNDTRNDTPAPETAPAPQADLVVKSWTEPPREPDAASREPVIAPVTGDGKTADAPSLRPTQEEPALSVANSIPAAELLAQLEGGAAARGREKTAVADAAMAGARAGRRDEFRLAIYQAIRQSIAEQATPDGTGAVRELVLEYAVGRNGEVGAVRVRQSSGSTPFDDSIIQAVKRARMPVPPAGLPDEALHFYMPFNFVRAPAR